MLITQKRPRDLHWYHAGPLLFGDWGTSRLYVLGLAFFYTAHASAFYLTAMSVLMVAVAWCYTHICRCFPEGGGVYTSARQINPLLSVIGATLLLCDYTVTVALSIVDGMHYFGVPEHLVLWVSMGCIALVGVLNWFGARSAGRFALIVAVGAIGVSVLIALACAAFVGDGLRTIELPQTGGGWDHWQNFVRIVLALSGLEAVANMTGLMREPVARTSRRTIWPVLAEVVTLNLVFGIALSGMPALLAVHVPDAIAHGSGELSAHVQAYRDTAMKVLATAAGEYWFGSDFGFWFGKVSGVVFGLLLLSAGNTAIMAMVSVLYSMSQDRELPRVLSRLNYSGVPWVGLVIAVVLPVVVLAVEHDVAWLAQLYAVGVCGAITISVLSTAFNRGLSIPRGTRIGMQAVGVVMALIELTILVTKPNATVFAGVLIAAVLCARQLVQWRRGALPPEVEEPETGWMSEVNRSPAGLDGSRGRIMLAARGRYQADFAIDMARRRKATLFVVYVRTLRVIDVTPGRMPRIEEDREAQESLGTVVLLGRQYGVPVVPIYVCSATVAEEILDYTVTFGCDTLIMGKSRRALFSRALAGDVVSEVARHLPDGVALITREPTPHPIGEPPANAADAVRAATCAETRGVAANGGGVGSNGKGTRG